MEELAALLIRLNAAVQTLVPLRDEQNGHSKTEWNRLQGKIEGVKLAISYIHEAMR